LPQKPIFSLKKHPKIPKITSKTPPKPDFPLINTQNTIFSLKNTQNSHKNTQKHHFFTQKHPKNPIFQSKTPIFTPPPQKKTHRLIGRHWAMPQTPKEPKAQPGPTKICGKMGDFWGF
jgi:hypothetical protein